MKKNFTNISLFALFSISVFVNAEPNKYTYRKNLQDDQIAMACASFIFYKVGMRSLKEMNRTRSQQKENAYSVFGALSFGMSAFTAYLAFKALPK